MQHVPYKSAAVVTLLDVRYLLQFICVQDDYLLGYYFVNVTDEVQVKIQAAVIAAPVFDIECCSQLRNVRGD